ncbi:hypothetical protein GIB67_003432 [Kingdonia uniflora]|uniref:Glutamine amidotransferase type-2 domain-containing protein n=1 Tax=Kingdonia uniflora TaxID=39325 RepID=A0A7J7P9X1_9MAGN|nr:hypothetical protein GIB67_003432 [Kingdonia uniflora]
MWMMLHDRLGCQFLAVGYTVVDLKAIMEGTYIKEDEEEEEVPVDGGVVTGLDSVPPRTDLENRGGEDNKKLQFAKAIKTVEDLAQKVKGKDVEIENAQRELVEAQTDMVKLKRRVESLTGKDLAIANSRVKKAMAGELSKKKKDDVGVSTTTGDVVSPSARIKELEADVAHIQAHKDELLKKSPIGESDGNDRELVEFYTQLEELRMMNTAELDKVAEQLAQHNVVMTRAAERMAWNDERYKDLKERHHRLQKHFSEKVFDFDVVLGLCGGKTMRRCWGFEACIYGYGKQRTWDRFKVRASLSLELFVYDKSIQVYDSSLLARYQYGLVGVAHNENLVNYPTLRAMLEDHGSIFSISSDIKVILHLIAISTARFFFFRIAEACEQLEGAYSLVFITEDKLVVMRDPYGFRPLVIGRKSNGAVVFAFETFIAVPDSGMVVALGYVAESGVPFKQGLIWSHYVGRMFIQPTQTIRDLGVKLKLASVKAMIEGKRVVVIDDSIERGTTSLKIVRLVKEAGTTEIHMRIASPPIIGSCYYGVDTPSSKELISNRMDVEKIRNYIGCDSLAFLLIDSLRKFMVEDAPGFCNAYFLVHYPVMLKKESRMKRSNVVGLSKDGTKPFLFCTVQKFIGDKAVTAVWNISTWNRIGHKRLLKNPVAVMSISLDGKYLALIHLFSSSKESKLRIVLDPSIWHYPWVQNIISS